VRAVAAALALVAALAVDARAGRPTLSWDTGDGMPVKLTILPALRSGRPPWLGPRAGRPAGDSWAAEQRVFSPGGRGEIALPPGSYDVVASRGPEWTITRERVVVGAAGAALAIRLQRAFDTAGWVAADFHVHADPSTDSAVPLAARAAQLAADGIDLFVSADHNIVTDYGAVPAITQVRGIEITTARWGHLVGFPIPAHLANKPRGEVLSRGKTGHDFIAAVRAVAPESIVIAVHPHSKSSSYLGDGRFDGARDAARPGFSYDFDAIEVLNGFNRGNFGAAIERNLRVWFQLLDHGHLVAAVGDSDTHWLIPRGGQGGWPRTFVQADATAESVVAGLRARRAQLTTGPFVRARCAGAGIGDLGRAVGGRVRCSVQVMAAPWVPVDSVTLYVNGAVHEVIPVPRSDAALRVDLERDLTLAADAYVIVRVDGPRGGLAPVAGDASLPLPVLAITNPIFVDVGGDGRFDPPRPHGPHTGQVRAGPTGG
jgi:hypothetical protein